MCGNMGRLGNPGGFGQAFGAYYAGCVSVWLADSVIKAFKESCRGIT